MARHSSSRPSFAASAVALAIAGTVASTAAAAGKPGEPPPASSTILEVEMDPTVPDAEYLAEWVHEESVAVLAAAGRSSRPGTIRVSVSGDLYDYHASVTTIRDGSTREQSIAWPCKCTNEELLAGIRTEVEAAVHELDRAGEARDAAAGRPAAKVRWSPFAELGLRGKLGLGVLAGGAATTIVGATLLALGDRSERGGFNYLAPGVPLLLTGIGLVTVGTTLTALEYHDLRRRRGVARVAVAPLVRHRGAHLGIVIRF